MRKTLLILLLALSIGCCACAEPLPMAAMLDVHTQFERYQNFQIDEATGEWSAHTLIADQLLSAVAQGDASGYMSGGVCILYPGIRGNRDLSLLEPVLYVYLLKNNPIKADALSIVAGKVRYDFALAAEETAVNACKCERFTLPLDKEMLPLLQSFAAEGGEVRIYGESKVFRTSIAEADKYRNSKLRVEAMSVAATRDFLPLWAEGYLLWDLNEAHWSDARPKMAAVKLDANVWPDTFPALESTTQCLDTQNRSAVRMYQQLLKDHAFFTGMVDTVFGKITREATKQIQQFYGLVPTGMPDHVLIERLVAGYQHAEVTDSVKPPVPLTESAVQAVPCETYAVEGQFSLRLDRAWMAYSFAPSNAADVLNQIWPTNRSSRLYICDGKITNLSTLSMNLPLQIQGNLKYNGVSFPCSIQCERDEGGTLGTTLLPMATSRLVVTCELPENMDISTAELELILQNSIAEIKLRFGT